MAAVISAVVAVAAFGCGGEGGERLSDEEFEEEAARVARDVLLTEDDFPSDWSGTPPDEEEDDDSDDFTEEDLEEFSEECRRLIEFFESTEEGENFANAVLEVESETFGDGDENEISNAVSVYRDGDELDDAWDLIEGFFDDCGDEFNDVFQVLFERELENDPEAAGAVGDLDVNFGFDTVDDLGERAIRLQGDFSFTALGIPFQLDFAITWIQVGRFVIGIETTDFAGLDDDLVDELTELTLERAREAEEMLPE
jgi:hypothetical protein